MSYPVDLTQRPAVTGFFDEFTNTISYVVADPKTGRCAIIDPVLDLDYASGRTRTAGAQRLVEHIQCRTLTVQWIIETHVHADHLSAAPWLKQQLGGEIAIGAQVPTIQKTFGEVFAENESFSRNGSQFDHLFDDGELYRVGEINAVAIFTPGHTPACMVHAIGDAVFVGDTLFMPDGGTARADFPGGDSAQLYDSIQKVLALPEAMRVFVCHDYGPGGREIQYETTIAEQRRKNIHVSEGTTRDAFVQMRDQRDATLSMPRLILPSLQVNMRAGELPCDEQGRATLKVPLNQL